VTTTLQGILAPVTTPFAANGELDRSGFQRNVRAHLASGLSGIVVTGSTGEAPLLDASERETLVDWARQVIPEDRVLIAGVGAESTRMTLQLTEGAAARGADAVLVIAPHYFGSAMTDDALRAHFLRVADASPVPVVLYNNPKYMHYRMTPAFVQELARHQNVIGMKDSTGDRALFESYMASHGPSFTVLTGNGTFLKTALDMGAPGGIIAASLFAPDLCVEVLEAVHRGDDATAGELQGRLTPLARVIVGELGPAGVKAALDCVGLVGGLARSPLPPLAREEQDRVRQLLRDAELPVAA
jgi:4-hydroxy-tetrahydrodipicolinate synthase